MLENQSINFTEPEKWMEITFTLKGIPPQVIEPIMEVFSRHCGGVEEITEGAPKHQIRGYLPYTDQGKIIYYQLKHELRHLAERNNLEQGEVMQKCSERFMGNMNWATNWKTFYKPTRIGQHFVIHPSWEKPGSLNPDDRVIMLDPGQAFGTGHHESTRLSIELMEGLLINHWRVADIGCGSGILSIAAAKAGAVAAWACDIDNTAVEAAEHNIRRNGVESVVKIVPGTMQNLSSHGPFHLVFANLLADILQDVGHELKAITKSEGYMIWSGILEHQLKEMQAVCGRLEIELREVQQENEWIALLIQVP